MSYYLRKEPYEQIIPEIQKTNGEVIPERKIMTDDRALYKDNQLSRFYRDDYPAPRNSGIHLYTSKTMKTIMTARQDVFDYCGEWFDVYDENGKVELSEG